MNTGSCHCGKIRYEVINDVGDVRYCYCDSCRKITGSAFTANAKVEANNFKILEGENLLSCYESAPEKYRYSCSNCASPIYACLGTDPEFIRIRLGSLDFAPKTQITAHMWVSEKPEWCQISDGLPQYEKNYDSSKN